jgi:hypothetical protein
MSLINFGKGVGKKEVECANMQIEAAQPAPPRALVDPAKQQRAKLARIAETNWLELEAQLERPWLRSPNGAGVPRSPNPRTSGCSTAKRPRTNGPITIRKDTATHSRQPWPRSPPPRQ